MQQRAHFVQHILEQTSAHLCGSVLILCEFLLNIVIIHIMLACSQFLTAVSLCRAPYNPQKGDFAAAARRDLQTEKGKQREIWLIRSSCVSVCKWRSQPARHMCWLVVESIVESSLRWKFLSDLNTARPIALLITLEVSALVPAGEQGTIPAAMQTNPAAHSRGKCTSRSCQKRGASSSTSVHGR